MSVVSVSPHAAKSQNAGHFFWMYHHLANRPSLDGPSFPVTIGPASNTCGHVIGAISDDARKQKFRVTPFFFRWHGWNRAEQIIEGLEARGFNKFQFYDGGLAELIVAIRLSVSHPNIKILFNFHWAVEWVSLLQGSNPALKLLSAALGRWLPKGPPNLYLTAETADFADLLNTLLGTKMAAYPIFSFFSVQERPSWKDRAIDVVIFPASAAYDEFGFSVQLCDALSTHGLETRIAVSREVWDEAFSDTRGMKTGAVNKDHVIFLPLESEAYQELLGSTRTVVLPYGAPYFKWGSSGKFNEAIASRAFPFVPDDTAISSQSSLGKQEHCYPANDFATASARILERLKSGFPEDLLARTPEDLVAMFNVRQESRTTNRLVWAAVILGLTLISSFCRTAYRYPKLADIRRVVSRRTLSRLLGR